MITMNNELKFILTDKKVVNDILLLVGVTILTTLILTSFDITKVISQFAQEHKELDKLIIVLAINSIYLSIFTSKILLSIKELLNKANTDPLIGLANRRKGSEYIQDEIIRVKNMTTSSSLIMYDIDDFKYINDTYGHNEGDIVLKDVSKIIKNYTRIKDSVIRWGGEEFMVICPDTKLVEAVSLANRFRKQIEDHNFEKGIKLTVSFGVIELKQEETLQEQIIRVDKKLYYSKEHGKNQVSF